MIPFQERKKFRQIMYSKATILVFFVVVVLLARGSWNIYEKAAIASAERNKVEQTLAEIERREAELQASLALRKTDQGIEEEIRQKFTVAKSGEEVVVVVDERSKKSENSEASEHGLLARILGFFRGE